MVEVRSHCLLLSLLLILPLLESALDLGIASPPPTAIQCSTRIAKQPDRFGFPSCLSAVHVAPIPSSCSQAVKEPSWQETMADEIMALESKQTWDLVPQPESSPVIDSKWVFFVKV